MNISYEEAMRRIDEYEKNDNTGYKCCRETRFPYDIHLYKGERQIIVVPLIKSMFWQRRELAPYCCLMEAENTFNIGRTVLEVFDYLLKSPVDTRTVQECAEENYIANNTSCKTFKAFAKNYSLCGVILNEDGSYIVSPTERLKNYNGYGGVEREKCFLLNKGASAEEIGKAVIAAFERSDEYEKDQKTVSYTNMTLPTN
ncbi:MAG: CdiI family contact-dependent growth inhibition immunity protein, partial [Oscillospiraceae bacterium]|nr:CdiI family contact-dependent growth inhibition immunity protein [Oscillospiraceae bacterium]